MVHLPMTTLSRWSVAITSAVAAIASAAFAVGFSSIEESNADWNRIALPTATEWFARLVPFGIGLAGFFLIANLIAAFRRSDAGLSVVSSIAWLFAFAWALACLIVWRMPYVVIGQ